MFGASFADNILAAEGVRDIVNLTQHPLARINDSFAFCHHGGWYECDLQTHALCAGALQPSDRWATFDFIECSFSNLQQHDADNTRLCAANASLAYKDMWSCAINGGFGPGPSGPQLLLASAQLALNIGVNSAPTIFVNGAREYDPNRGVVPACAQPGRTR